MVRHPFVEAGLSKADIRSLAAMYDLKDIAELPSAPCLSSRVESGIRIDPNVLRIINRVETLVRNRLNPETVRCRIRSDGMVIELDDETLAGLRDASLAEIIDVIRANVALDPAVTVRFAIYARGSAFLKATLK